MRLFPDAQRPNCISFSTCLHQLSLGLKKGLLPKEPALASPLPGLPHLVGPLLGSHHGRAIAVAANLAAGKVSDAAAGS